MVKTVDFVLDASDFLEVLDRANKSIDGNLSRIAGKGANLIRSTAIKSIQSGDKTGIIYKRKSVSHRASAAGEAPASDTGILVSSMFVDKERLSATVGNTLLYARYLEFGTLNREDGSELIAPRPWLFPAVEANRKKIRDMVKKAVKDSLKGKTT